MIFCLFIFKLLWYVTLTCFAKHQPTVQILWQIYVFLFLLQWFFVEILLVK